jgi:hypothetical protein
LIGVPMIAFQEKERPLNGGQLVENESVRFSASK